MYESIFCDSFLIYNIFDLGIKFIFGSFTCIIWFECFTEREKEDDDNKIGEAIDRIQRCFRFYISFYFSFIFSKKTTENKNS